MYHTSALTRRELFVASAALGAGIARPNTAGRFAHRGYLGWITDLATTPDAHAPWPSMRLNAPLLDDYRHTFDVMKQLGFNEAVIWGFYVSRYWPSDIASAVNKERAAKVQKLIDTAHERGIKIYTGLGVYSWGFQKIIEEHKGLSRTNPRAMCGSLPEAWEWMRKVTDFVFDRFPIDGASLQSADQGRCECVECRRYTDTEYHVNLDLRVAEYVRGKWPGKTLAVSGWGMDFRSEASLPALIRLSEKIDYLIDVQDSAQATSPEFRRKVIKSLKCSFGTLGGPQVEPPQHWERDRWFLPTAKHDGEHLSALYQDGGRACEYFFHILKNPGDEVSFWVAGKLLSDPGTSWQKHLYATIAQLYGTKGHVTSDLAELFVRAEDAYLRHKPDLRSGTISLEPLEEDHAGPPQYLTKRFSQVERKAYRAEIEKLIPAFRAVTPDVPEKARMRLITRCLKNVLKDIDSVS
jgi:hypothetical protein